MEKKKSRKKDQLKQKIAVDHETVEHVALMARIKLSEDEIELFREQFEDILMWFARLRDVDVENVEPTFHVIDLSNVFREDKVTPSLPPEKALQNAPKKKDGFIIGPKIL